MIQEGLEVGVLSRPDTGAEGSRYDVLGQSFGVCAKWLLSPLADHRQLNDQERLFVNDFIASNPRPRIDLFAVDPILSSLLISGKAYRLFCEAFFSSPLEDDGIPDFLLGHQEVIKLIELLGYPLVDANGQAKFSLKDLAQQTPLNFVAHIQLVCVLAEVFASKSLTVDQLIKSTRQFAPFFSSHESPSSLEDGLVLWITKVTSFVNAVFLESKILKAPFPLIADINELHHGLYFGALLCYYLPFAVSPTFFDVRPESGNSQTFLRHLSIVNDHLQSLGSTSPFDPIDFVHYSESLRPILRAWLVKLYRIFESIPVSDRLTQPAFGSQPGQSASKSSNKVVVSSSSLSTPTSERANFFDQNAPLMASTPLGANKDPRSSSRTAPVVATHSIGGLFTQASKIRSEKEGPLNRPTSSSKPPLDMNVVVNHSSSRLHKDDPQSFSQNRNLRDTAPSEKMHRDRDVNASLLLSKETEKLSSSTTLLHNSVISASRPQSARKHGQTNGMAIPHVNTETLDSFRNSIKHHQGPSMPNLAEKAFAQGSLRESRLKSVLEGHQKLENESERVLREFNDAEWVDLGGLNDQDEQRNVASELASLNQRDDHFQQIEGEAHEMNLPSTFHRKKRRAWKTKSVAPDDDQITVVPLPGSLQRLGADVSSPIEEISANLNSEDGKIQLEYDSNSTNEQSNEMVTKLPVEHHEEEASSSPKQHQAPHPIRHVAFEVPLSPIRSMDENLGDEAEDLNVTFTQPLRVSLAEQPSHEETRVPQGSESNTLKTFLTDNLDMKQTRDIDSATMLLSDSKVTSRLLTLDGASSSLNYSLAQDLSVKLKAPLPAPPPIILSQPPAPTSNSRKEMTVKNHSSSLSPASTNSHSSRLGSMSTPTTANRHLSMPHSSELPLTHENASSLGATLEVPVDGNVPSSRSSSRKPSTSTSEIDPFEEERPASESPPPPPPPPQRNVDKKTHPEVKKMLMKSNQELLMQLLTSPHLSDSSKLKLDAIALKIKAREVKNNQDGEAEKPDPPLPGSTGHIEAVSQPYLHKDMNSLSTKDAHDSTEVPSSNRGELAASSSKVIIPLKQRENIGVSMHLPSLEREVRKETLPPKRAVKILIKPASASQDPSLLRENALTKHVQPQAPFPEIQKRTTQNTRVEVAMHTLQARLQQQQSHLHEQWASHRQQAGEEILKEILGSGSLVLQMNEPGFVEPQSEPSIQVSAPPLCRRKETDAFDDDSKSNRTADGLLLVGIAELSSPQQANNEKKPQEKSRSKTSEPLQPKTVAPLLHAQRKVQKFVSEDSAPLAPPTHVQSHLPSSQPNAVASSERYIVAHEALLRDNNPDDDNLTPSRKHNVINFIIGADSDCDTDELQKKKERFFKAKQKQKEEQAERIRLMKEAAVLNHVHQQATISPHKISKPSHVISEHHSDPFQSSQTLFISSSSHPPPPPLPAPSTARDNMAPQNIKARLQMPPEETSEPEPQEHKAKKGTHHPPPPRTNTKPPHSSDKPTSHPAPRRQGSTKGPSSASHLDNSHTRQEESKQRTNKQLIKLAMTHVCLAGHVSKEPLEEVLSVLEASSSVHFLLLLRSPTNLKYRGLYAYDLESNKGTRLHGVGPKAVSPDMASMLYKYNSGSRAFFALPTMTMSVAVDALTLKDVFWKKKGPLV